MKTQPAAVSQSQKTQRQNLDVQRGSITSKVIKEILKRSDLSDGGMKALEESTVKLKCVTAGKRR